MGILAIMSEPEWAYWTLYGSLVILIFLTIKFLWQNRDRKWWQDDE